MDFVVYVVMGGISNWFSSDKKLSRYSYIKRLGKGTTSTVDKYYDRQTETYVAIKKVALPFLSTARYQESESLATLSGKHPAFLEFYRSYSDANYISIVMEAVEGDELYGRLSKGPLSEKEAGIYFYQLVSAMEVAHEEGIIHRDLKPEHVYIHKGTLKIVDWGYSVSLTGNEIYTNACGSPHYAPPEILGDPPTISTGNDVWSLGAILFSMLTGRFLIDASNIEELLDKIRDLKFDLDKAEIPTGPMNLLEKILVPLSKRITCKEILKDPWVSGFKETPSGINGGKNRSRTSHTCLGSSGSDKSPLFV